MKLPWWGYWKGYEWLPFKEWWPLFLGEVGRRIAYSGYRINPAQGVRDLETITRFKYGRVKPLEFNNEPYYMYRRRLRNTQERFDRYSESEWELIKNNKERKGKEKNG